MNRAACLAAVFCCVASVANAQTTCRQALVLGLDVSGSVDADEYRLQLDGLATALGDPDVAAAILDLTGGAVRLAVYEWSDPGQGRIIVDWSQMNDLAALAGVQSTLLQTQRAQMGPRTGIGDAMRFGFALLDRQSECWTRTLDMSGDGKGNAGSRPQDVTNLPSGVTVNGLVIGVDDFNTAAARDLQIGELAAYYSAYVIRGPSAFVETALGFEDYAAAMKRKLLRELTTFAIGELAPTTSLARAGQ